ncbi:MAG: hypothetical protein ACTINA_19660 [Pseudoalteromonas distincta]
MNQILNSLIVLFLLYATNLQAHEIWLVKADTNQVHLFLGEPGDAESGDNISGLRNTKIYTDTISNSIPIVQHQTHWSAKVTQEGDVRATIDDLWQPWDMEEVPTWQFWKSSKKQAAKLFAKAGRNDTKSKTEFEFVPVSAQSNTFILTYLNKPVQEHSVMVLTPNKTLIKSLTNKQGEITISTDITGLYVISSDYPVDGKTMIAGNNVDSTFNITSISFWVK